MKKTNLFLLATFFYLIKESLVYIAARDVLFCCNWIQLKVVFKLCSGNKLAAEPFPSAEPLALPLLALSLKTHLVSRLVRLSHQEVPYLDWSLGPLKMLTFC